MIPHGRRTYLLDDVAAKFTTMSLTTAKKRRPWEDSGHPEPLTATTMQRAPKLWDAEQVDAYHDGRPIPQLPTNPSDEDLLDRLESAAFLNIDPVAFERYSYRTGLLPVPARETGRTRWWRRKDLDTWSRPGRGVGGGGTAHSEFRTRITEALSNTRHDFGCVATDDTDDSTIITLVVDYEPQHGTPYGRLIRGGRIQAHIVLDDSGHLKHLGGFTERLEAIQAVRDELVDHYIADVVAGRR